MSFEITLKRDFSKFFSREATKVSFRRVKLNSCPRFVHVMFKNREISTFITIPRQTENEFNFWAALQKIPLDSSFQKPQNLTPSRNCSTSRTTLTRSFRIRICFRYINSGKFCVRWLFSYFETNHQIFPLPVARNRWFQPFSSLGTKIV